MRLLKRDSPAVPETRPNRSPEGEVSRLRDFPRGNTEERAPSLSLVSKDFCSPALLLASSLTSLPPAVAPPAQSSLQLCLSMAPHCPSEKAPNSLAQHSKHVRICPPTFPLPLVFILDSRCSRSPTSGHLHNIPIRLVLTPSHVLFQPPELSAPPGCLSASYSGFKSQFKCRLLCKSLTSPRHESLLPLGSILPPEHIAHGVFGNILSNF